MAAMFPTPRTEWVKAGDAVVSVGGMRGEVVKVIPLRSLPDVKVRWENGHEGRVRITQVRKV